MVIIGSGESVLFMRKKRIYFLYTPDIDDFRYKCLVLSRYYCISIKCIVFDWKLILVSDLVFLVLIFHQCYVSANILALTQQGIQASICLHRTNGSRYQKNSFYHSTITAPSKQRFRILVQAVFVLQTSSSIRAFQIPDSRHCSYFQQI